MQNGITAVEAKLKEHHQLTQFYLKELKTALSKANENQTSCIGYFTYALQLSHGMEQESFCLGSFHIKNIGNVDITNPIIHLTLSEDAPFSLQGKFVNSQSTLSNKLTNGWERMDDPANPSVFKLKPLGISIIPPGGLLSFTNFQLIWFPSSNYAGSVTGTFFSDQTPDGMAALNSININGSADHKEEA
ncbi:hypothetical protein [Sporosarcina cyprini]|uniref:hypothetical protein n=1 Tax=Sporosarcina cyprini TaxID=2910523 RepID=UPI001EDD4321|nr:hypothetical protein [Sporosarcina cyprini]MCG3087213.1 hypothetical protein [Sporosarcina cyprini]